MFVLSSGSLYKYGLNRIFEFAKEADFDAVEVVVNNVYDTRDTEYLKQLIGHFKMPVAALVTPLNLTPKKLGQLLELAAAIQCERIIVRSPLFTEARLAHWFRTELPKLQNTTTIQLCVENPKAGSNFLLPLYAIRSIEDLRRYPHLSLDTSHLVSHRLLLLHVWKLIHRRVSYVHLSNNFQGQEHWRLNEGDLPLESFLTFLKKTDYTGPIALKYSLEAIEAGDTEKVRKNLAKAKTFYEKYYENAAADE